MDVTPWRPNTYTGSGQKEAREKAESATEEASRQTWLEIAMV